MTREQSVGYQGKVIPPRAKTQGSQEERDEILARSTQATHQPEQSEFDIAPEQVADVNEVLGKDDERRTYKRHKVFCQACALFLDAVAEPTEDVVKVAVMVNESKAMALFLRHAPRHVDIVETQVRIRRGPAIYEEV